MIDSTTNHYQILYTNQFVERFLEDLAQAEEQIAVQFMTFEGDEAGWLVAEALIAQAQRGVRVRALVDYFSNYYLSDCFVMFPRAWREFISTQKMFRALKKAGVELRRTGPPVRPSLPSFIQRNHKKLILIDQTAYLGGVNISDHNFAWHDFMVRLQGETLDGLWTDFEASWRGEVHLPKGDLVDSSRLWDVLEELILGAKKEVIISSPYIWDRSTIHLLLQAARNGCRVVVLSIERSNFTFIRWATAPLLHLLQEQGVEVYYYNNFSHAKYLIVDRAAVIFGSANFGYSSYEITEELSLLSHDPVLIQMFIEELYEPAQEHIEPVPRIKRQSLLDRFISWAYWKFLQYNRRELPPTPRESGGLTQWLPQRWLT